MTPRRIRYVSAMAEEGIQLRTPRRHGLGLAHMIGCFLTAAAGLACVWTSWISITTQDFGAIRITDGWGQGLHGCSIVVCDPDPVPWGTHALAGCAMATGVCIALWLVTRHPLFAGCAALTSLAAAAYASAVFAGFYTFLSADTTGSSLMAVSIHIGFPATVLGFLSAAAFAARTVRLQQTMGRPDGRRGSARSSPALAPPADDMRRAGPF
jgi:hypothetical protein